MRKHAPRDEFLPALVKQAEHYANFMMRGAAGTVPPTIMALSPEGLTVHVAPKFTSEAEKNSFAKIGRLIAVGYRADAIAIISNAWMLAPKHRGQPLDMSVPPSQSPDREEVVAIMAEGRGRAAQRFLFIQRDSFGKFLGFGTSLLPEMDKAEGRFVGLLPPKAPTEQMASAARNLLQSMGVSVERH